MKPQSLITLAGLLLASVTVAVGQDAVDGSRWTVYITNDTCFDYTWALTEEESRQSAADLVLSHLKEMTETDNQPSEVRDRFNMPVTQQALCFLERYPEHKAELLRRIRDGRVHVGPFLNNTLWGLQSVESAIRCFYPIRRLEKEWGVRADVAEHIELPSLPWGVASILAGCGFRWLVIPFLNYDSTFSGLNSPPLFVLEGPDGSRIHVVMDSWASLKEGYGQGAGLLKRPERLTEEWIPHYSELGKAYPLRAVLASGTHSDLSLTSASQTAGFAKGILDYNSRQGSHPTLINATFPQFCKVADEAEGTHPFMPTLRGSFGHSWELWPVSLAKYVSALRVNEEAYGAAETLLALAALRRPEVLPASRSGRLQAEWAWTMLADHAWNGADDRNRVVNADLRRRWSEQLGRLAESLSQQAWAALGLQATDSEVTVFNSLSFPRAELVRVPGPAGVNVVLSDGAELPSQRVNEDGTSALYFVSPRVPGFGLSTLQLRSTRKRATKTSGLHLSDRELESPYYRLKVDPATGGVTSLLFKPSGTELVAGHSGRKLGQLIFFDGREHTLNGGQSEVAAAGPVLARLRLTGSIEGIEVTTFITVYAGLDRVDFDTRIMKPATTQEQRLIQIFPVMTGGAIERIADMGAVIRFRPQPEGDLLPGADTRRTAMQDFVDVSPSLGPGVTLAPREAFALRNDLDPISFEVLGNDQNYKEVTRDQNGATEFQFRYSLRAHAGAFNGPDTLTWSRSVRSPLLALLGKATRSDSAHGISLDGSRAISTCLKPADDPDLGGTVLRIKEVAGESGPLKLGVRGFRRAYETDLLERNLRELPVVDGQITIQLRGNGYAAVRVLD
jgi:hypothetical protein